MQHWLTLSWLTGPRSVIGLSLGVVGCAQIFWWRRRDNILAYSLVATWLVTILIPLYGTPVTSQWPSQVVWRVAWILLIGAAAYLVGLAIGGGLGSQTKITGTAIWSRPFSGEIADTIHLWARRFGVASLVSLGASFALLGYVPALASDRQSAKYGVGIYAAGAARGGNVYHLALALASMALPIMMIVTWRRPTMADLALCGAIFVGLLMTLSRQDAFSGPLIVLVAIAVERKWTPVAVLAVVCFALLAGTVFNELVFPSVPGQGRSSLATKVAGSAPDVHDQIAFMSGFETLGNQFVGSKNLTSVLAPNKGYYNPATYSVRTETLLPDVSGVGTGGIRLPGPEWGYVAYGWFGVMLWSLVSGLFAGWGTVIVRRMLDNVAYREKASVNFVLAWVFFTGTFGILQSFYFPERADVVLVVGALVFSFAGVSRRWWRRRQAANQAFWSPA